MTKYSNGIAFAGRVFLSMIFVLSGVGKIATQGVTIGYIASAGLPLPTFSFLVAVAVELGGGLLLLAGYKTRPAAVVLAGFTMVTAIVFHHDFADQNQMIHFLKNVAIVGGLLEILAFGAVGWSVDAVRRKV